MKIDGCFSTLGAEFLTIISHRKESRRLLDSRTLSLEFQIVFIVFVVGTTTSSTLLLIRLSCLHRSVSFLSVGWLSFTYIVSKFHLT